MNEPCEFAKDFREQVGRQAVGIGSLGEIRRMAIEACAIINQQAEQNKKLRETIEAALRISDLWTLGEVETMFEDEAEALLLMKESFEQALKEPN